MSENVYACAFACTIFGDESSQGRGSACLKMCMRALLHLKILFFFGNESSQGRGSACLKMCSVHFCI